MAENDGAMADWNPNLQDGRTALMFAANKYNGENIQMLLDAGADKDAKDNVRIVF